MIKWTNDKQVMEIESRIADRAVNMAKKFGVQYDKMTALMDIDACPYGIGRYPYLFKGRHP